MVRALQLYEISKIIEAESNKASLNSAWLHYNLSYPIGLMPQSIATGKSGGLKCVAVVRLKSTLCLICKKYADMQ